MTSFNVVPYGGWQTCYRLASDRLELIAAGEVGPRLIHFGLAGGANQLLVDRASSGLTGGDEWHLYGGHRLWNAPERFPETYAPDNAPVSAAPLTAKQGLTITGPVETLTGLQKEIEVTLSDSGDSLRVLNRLWNRTDAPQRLSAWSITSLAGGGVGIMPLPAYKAHAEGAYQAAARLSLWPYTDLADPRWAWGGRCVLLRHDAAMALPQKIGSGCAEGWAAHWNDGVLFVKHYTHDPGADYPDEGASFEMFANASMIELETLSPFTVVEPGAYVEQAETWHLFADVPPVRSAADVEAHVLPLVMSSRL